MKPERVRAHMERVLNRPLTGAESKAAFVVEIIEVGRRGKKKTARAMVRAIYDVSGAISN